MIYISQTLMNIGWKKESLRKWKKPKVYYQEQLEFWTNQLFVQFTGALEKLRICATVVRDSVKSEVHLRHSSRKSK